MEITVQPNSDRVGPLRHLFVFVDEPDPTVSTWDVCEIREGSEWIYLLSSVDSLATWIEAWRAGSC
ncbi:hypothetical protein [Variovorax sp. J22R115]|uniref:hypothetical protein n=1 Tax=Variovorax sp. J22R115 TaxID=3053509 RepID=UPI002576B72E|nr:hypothetical protein [Variovorax sp. J22R115]MDM0049806.1 hypothetical protein [Variovorax sp. J22R115]